MDPLPLVPDKPGKHNVVITLRQSFQDTLDGLTYPRDAAENIISYNVDTELTFKQNATQVQEINNELSDALAPINDAARELISQKGSYLIEKNKIDSVYDIKESVRLKHCNLFRDIKLQYVHYFNFLQKSDLLPDLIKWYLDYKLNEGLHLCAVCFDKTKENKTPKRRPEGDARVKKVETSATQMEKRQKNQRVHDEEIMHSFMIIPKKIDYHNYETGKTYKKNVKLVNTSPKTISLSIGKYAQDRSLSVLLNANSRIASGMSVVATIVVKPEIYRNIRDSVSFRSSLGDDVVLQIETTRDIPRLITCIFKSNSSYIDCPRPGSIRFLEDRREALNSSIDCGSCLVGDYVYLSVFVENRGITGKFFIITEEEWFFQSIQNVSYSLELSNESFWVYPTYFELNNRESTEISILFHPFRSGVHVEKYYIICNNNAFEQFEILGDALEFNNDILKIDVPPIEVAINKKDEYIIFLGNIVPNFSSTVTLSVHNTSSLLLHCEWRFRNKPKDGLTYNINESWVTLLNNSNPIAPYSTSDFNFEINVYGQEQGYYNIFLSFFVIDVPIIGLQEDEEFLVIEKELDNQLTKCVDIQVMEVEIAAYVNTADPPVSCSSQSINCEIPEPCHKPRVTFSSSFLEFGILPTGLNVAKHVYVLGLTREKIEWQIMEVRYNTDNPPFMEVIGAENLSCQYGEFRHQWQKKKIVYNVIGKVPVSWVSMLLLVTNEGETSFNIEAICIVIYEVIHYDITINGHTKDPIICPMKLMYVGVPSLLTLIIENHSPITGCFWFQKPFGEDADKVCIEYSPRYSILKPLEAKEVTVKITGNDIGIFESVYVSCFIGRGQESIILRILCAIDGVHVFFYLPAKKDGFHKVIWPPKIVYEYDEDWVICPCTMEYNAEEQTSYLSPTSSGDLTKNTTLTSPENLKTDNIYNKLSETVMDEHENTETDTAVSDKESTGTSTNESLTKKDLQTILQEQFGEQLVMQENIAEVYQVPLKTLTKFSFYFENITTIKTGYAVESTNFDSNRNFDHLALKLKQKTEVELWDDVIVNEYGILVRPEVDNGDLPDFGLVKVNVLIFANTWGIYIEEITIDIPDIPCFTFSLLIEVVGPPITFPMAVNAITECPTIRFGHVSYCSEMIQRKIRIANTSCIPVNIIWHIFLKTSKEGEPENAFNVTFDIVDDKYFKDQGRFILTDTYYGRETTDVFMVLPEDTILSENSSRFIEIVMKPECFSPVLEKYNANCTIIGHLFLEDRFRNTDLEECQVKLKITSALELPVLTLDFSRADTDLMFYANDIIFNEKVSKSSRLIFQNSNRCAAKVKIEIDAPFEIIQAKRMDINWFVVEALSCLEITVNCNIDHRKILELSKLVYPKHNEGSENEIELKDVYPVDKEHNVLHIQKHFKITQLGAPRQVFPMDMYIYFPQIKAKPTILDFEFVTVGNTKKALLTIFNQTGSRVSYEMFKTLASEEIFIAPHYGDIKKSTGTNKQFAEIFVYFTPRECKHYQEHLRIVTNIPNYYIEVPVKGFGSLNEKYLVDYKI